MTAVASRQAKTPNRKPAGENLGDAQALLRQLIAGYKSTFLVQAAAELGLADLLAMGGA